MRKRIIIKIVIILISILTIGNINTVNAAESEHIEVTQIKAKIQHSIAATTSSSIDDVMGSADDFLTAGDNADPNYTSIDMNNLKDGSNKIFTLLFVIGTIVAVIVGFILGIQFMTAETESKAKIKETLIVYFIGCVVVFGAFTIWKVIVTIGNQM